jgi:hypothetical protein
MCRNYCSDTFNLNFLVPQLLPDAVSTRKTYILREWFKVRDKNSVFFFIFRSKENKLACSNY